MLPSPHSGYSYSGHDNRSFTPSNGSLSSVWNPSSGFRQRESAAWLPRLLVLTARIQCAGQLPSAPSPSHHFPGGIRTDQLQLVHNMQCSRRCLKHQGHPNRQTGNHIDKTGAVDGELRHGTQGVFVKHGISDLRDTLQR